MLNKNTFTLSYKGISKTYLMNKKGLSDQTLYANRVDICKHSFAESIVTKELLDKKIIAEDNLVINDDGKPSGLISKNTLSEDIKELLKTKVDDVYKNIVVS